MSRDWKEFWANQDDPRHPRDTQFFVDHGRELSLVCGDPTGKTVLEFGCGTGALFEPMGLGRAKTYRGVDFSEKMLAVFRTAHPTVNLVCAEASSYLDRAKYDLIFSSAVAQYLSRDMFRRHVANARAMLAPGGRLVVGAVPWRGARAAFHLQAYGLPEQRKLVRGLAVLALSHAGIDRLGRWYSYRECSAEAGRHGLAPAFFGCLMIPYRFHVRMDDVAHG
ncbi:MAG: class I SAM-dependent methyltransferase [Alphaproteobacteria bacterium]|nr:class I SAM-dependent methyltransferase [Alphaproteobacteria bacterium]